HRCHRGFLARRIHDRLRRNRLHPRADARNPETRRCRLRRATMFFTPESLAANSRLRGHWTELWANRNIYNRQQRAMIEANRAAMTPEMLACNAVGGFARDFWAELDRQIIQMRDQETGMEIVTDLRGVQTVLPIGKTAKRYNVVGDIADDVSISLDGQPPYSFDHTEYDSDGDPIPVFTAGYGCNWRHA